MTPAEQVERVWTLVFCDSCGEMLGVQDYLRIQVEHLEQENHRGLHRIEVVPDAGFIDNVSEEGLDKET